MSGSQDPLAPALEKDLPYGRTLRVAVDGLEIRGPEGSEVFVIFTEQGPVVRLRAARLELEATDELRLAARRVTVQAEDTVTIGSSGGVAVHARGDLDLHASGELRATAEMIHLN